MAVINLTGAFLHADVDEDITMLLEGWLAELMVIANPQAYQKYATVNVK